MAMTLEFPGGIPEGAIEWLRQNVGVGNVYPIRDCWAVNAGTADEFDWYHERKETWITQDDRDRKMYTDTITVCDPELALLFSLKFLGQQ